ncbi:hypothetical protein SAMN05421538_1225 [Paracoccus isoporae]|uniref:Uncharacterized protein n=1 Tax=Paracoccus isoporae TaxID=591205 RepID=A0A1G7HH32_9RHOB|nr:hypothetical protein SAMN05421538_1225 [Paracoccus isoporae]
MFGAEVHANYLNSRGSNQKSCRRMPNVRAILHTPLETRNLVDEFDRNAMAPGRHGVHLSQFDKRDDAQT